MVSSSAGGAVGPKHSSQLPVPYLPELTKMNNLLMGSMSGPKRLPQRYRGAEVQRGPVGPTRLAQRYNYWRGFGSDGEAGLYDFVEK